ncbi:MAG: CDP-glucose 4,6-dehydratase [Nitrospirae bacterium]|nr:CDP-glucose 4,6-dehydratase [Nitrospirota bacterium]
MIKKEFWDRKKVFITGHTGFKGSWLSLWLTAMGAKVTGYALDPPTVPSLYELCKIGESVHSIKGDIRDYKHLLTAIQESKPDIVIHLAAQSLVLHSYEHPVETFSTNVMGTVNLLEAVRNTKNIRAVLNVTTDKCYENKEWTWGYRENDTLGGHDPYSGSKVCSEMVTASYRHSFFNLSDYKKHRVLIATARAGNVIGGGDWAENRLIPDCIRAISDNKKIIIRNPNFTRSWQHVLEPLAGYMMLSQRLYEGDPASADAWNFGTDDIETKNIESVVKIFCLMWGKGAAYSVKKSKQLTEAKYLKLDSSKARMMLGWRTRWNLDRALQSIVEWTKGYIGGVGSRALCLNQINEYIKDM